MKILPTPTVLSHADRQTDRHEEPNKRFFYNIAKAPKIKFSIYSGKKFFLCKSRRRVWGAEVPLCSFLSLVLNINIMHKPIYY